MVVTTANTPLFNRFTILSSVFVLFLVGESYAQSGAIIPEHGAGHAIKPSCVILKRMGPADQITSHMYSFGIRGKQFQYVEGKLPDGFPFHGRLTDHDVRNLQSRGAEVIVLNQNYTPDELKQGRTDCQAETGTTPTQAGEQDLPSQEPNQSAGRSKASLPVVSAAPSPVVADAQAQLYVTSTPDAADIEIDGIFVGSTPSTVSAPAGQHEISVKKLGFKSWDRKIGVSSGQVNVHAELETNTIHAGAGSQAVSPMTAPRIEAPAQMTQRSVSNYGFIGASSDGDPKLRQDGIGLSHIAEEGPASQAGLKVGDVILAIDDHYVFTIDELASEIRQHAPGTSVRLRYRRRSLIYEGSAKLSEKAPNEGF